MQIKQVSLFVENHPGALSAVCRVLRDNGLNIRTLSLADTQHFGILRLLVQDSEKARKVLEAAGFLVKVNDVLAILVPDRPGGLADVLEIIDRHGISVEYMYAFTFGRQNQAVIVFRFDNQEQAFEALAGEPIELVNPKEIFA